GTNVGSLALGSVDSRISDSSSSPSVLSYEASALSKVPSAKLPSARQPSASAGPESNAVSGAALLSSWATMSSRFATAKTPALRTTNATASATNVRAVRRTPRTLPVHSSLDVIAPPGSEVGRGIVSLRHAPPHGKWSFFRRRSGAVASALFGSFYLRLLS